MDVVHAGNCCSAQAGMPWFCRTLPQEVSEGIEVHIYAERHHDTNEEINVELVEVYIQWIYFPGQKRSTYYEDRQFSVAVYSITVLQYCSIKVLQYYSIICPNLY